MPNKNRLPPEVIDHWPEVLKDVEIKAVPVKYISGIHVSFNDGKTWEIDIDTDYTDDDSLENTLNSFFEEYNDVIEAIEFRIDTPSLVSDVKARTKTFMKRS